MSKDISRVATKAVTTVAGGMLGAGSGAVIGAAIAGPPGAGVGYLLGIILGGKAGNDIDLD